MTPSRMLSASWEPTTSRQRDADDMCDDRSVSDRRDINLPGYRKTHMYIYIYNIYIYIYIYIYIHTAYVYDWM